MRNKNVKRIALYGILACVALVLSFVESQIPVFYGVPGMKLGLTNIVVLFALYRVDYRGAFIINLVRIFLSAFLFGNGVSLVFSLCGGMLSTLLMMLMKRSEKFRIITVSIVGGLSHNVGQILVAIFMMGTLSIAWYLPVLWIFGLISGSIIGIIGYETVKRIKIAI